MDFHLVVLERAAKRELQLALLFGDSVEFGLVFAMDAATLVLRAVERQVGVAQQFFHTLAIARSQGRTDARADVKDMVFDMVRRGKRRDNRLG